ncbi:MAG: hypothetical protein V3576_03615 [Candidatus Cloacimonadota bacterium]
MLRKQNGISVYTVLSVILFLALIFVLAIPHFFNLDKEKNVDDCINNMKEIWVATTDYIRENQTDFGGDLQLLYNTRKKSDPSRRYLERINFCPETARLKTSYIVYGKYVQDMVGTETRDNIGVIVVCPNLKSYFNHYLPKAFYENMEPTQLQNMMTEDLDYIDEQTATNGSRKTEAVEKYINIWKTNPEAYNLRKNDSTALKAMIFPDQFRPAEPTF